MSEYITFEIDEHKEQTVRVWSDQEKADLIKAFLAGGWKVKDA